MATKTTSSGNWRRFASDSKGKLGSNPLQYGLARERCVYCAPKWYHLPMKASTGAELDELIYRLRMQSSAD